MIYYKAPYSAYYDLPTDESLCVKVDDVRVRVLEVCAQALYHHGGGVGTMDQARVMHRVTMVILIV